MLTCLRIRDLAIIDSLEVELGPGLNVLTGETGAGKSILVDALELVLGGKAKPELVRTGTNQAEVEALFELGDDPRLRARLEALDIDTGGDELLVRRVVKPGGRSRAYVNGRLASAQQLAELSRGLCDISSQHEHHGLTHPSAHLNYLDAFAGLVEQRRELAQAAEGLRGALGALEDFEARVRERGEREDLLRFQLGEIEDVAPGADELTTLTEQRDRLRHADALRRLVGGAEATLYGDDASLCAQLARVDHDLLEAAGLDSSLVELSAQLQSARTALEELGRDLGHYCRDVQADPAALDEAEQRLSDLKRLSRKYGGSLEAVLEHARQAGDELQALAEHEGHSEALRAQVEVARKKAAKLARALSAKRKRAAQKLGKAITDELVSLGMGGACIEVRVSALEASDDAPSVEGHRLGATGIDHVEFLMAPNRGEQARPLRKIASGGELSRVMLAIKRVLTGLGPSGLYVFDEVDTGVGGAIAEVIGRKIKDVARHSQVLCITHLPQIAVFADTHYRVEKSERRGRTQSQVLRLDVEQREAEVARMLGGISVTKKTRAVAGEMLQQAQAC